MALEAIKGAGMTIQGSSSSAVRKVQMQPKEQLASNEAVSKELAVKTTDIAQFGGQNRGNGGEQQELYKDKDNPQIKKLIEELKKHTAENQEVIYGVHEQTRRSTIKIVDKTTREVVREFPQEEVLDKIGQVLENAGLLVDKKL